MTAKVNEGKKAERLEEIELRFLFIWGGGCFYLLQKLDGYKKREEGGEGQSQQTITLSLKLLDHV